MVWSSYLVGGVILLLWKLSRSLLERRIVLWVYTVILIWFLVCRVTLHVGDEQVLEVRLGLEKVPLLVSLRLLGLERQQIFIQIIVCLGHCVVLLLGSCLLFWWLLFLSIE